MDPVPADTPRRPLHPRAAWAAVRELADARPGDWITPSGASLLAGADVRRVAEALERMAAAGVVETAPPVGKRGKYPRYRLPLPTTSEADR